MAQPLFENDGVDMKSVRLTAIMIFLFTATWATNASAQRIRNFTGDAQQQYGGQEESGGDTPTQNTGANVYYPGQPVPQQQQAQGQAQQQAGQEGQEDAPQGSFVTVFKPTAGQQTPAAALNLPPDQMYRGLIPGERDQVGSFLSGARRQGENSSNANRVLWIGFQAKDDTTRVFFQTAREVDYQLDSGDGELLLTFNDTRIPVRNFSRFIDTTFFERNVTMVEAEQSGRRTVVIHIKLRQPEQPSIDQQGSYLYLDFPYTAPQSETEGEEGDE